MSFSTEEAKDVLQQVERIKKHPLFNKLTRPKAVLDFIVDKTLAGDASQISDCTIAIALKLKAGNDKAKSNARTAAGELRRRLATYYFGPGANDPIIISIPSGTFVPKIERRVQELNTSPFSITRNELLEALRAIRQSTNTDDVMVEQPQTERRSKIETLLTSIRDAVVAGDHEVAVHLAQELTLEGMTTAELRGLLGILQNYNVFDTEENKRAEQTAASSNRLNQRTESIRIEIQTNVVIRLLAMTPLDPNVQYAFAGAMLFYWNRAVRQKDWSTAHKAVDLLCVKYATFNLPEAIDERLNIQRYRTFRMFTLYKLGRLDQICAELSVIDLEKAFDFPQIAIALTLNYVALHRFGNIKARQKVKQQIATLFTNKERAVLAAEQITDLTGDVCHDGREVCEPILDVLHDVTFAFQHDSQIRHRVIYAKALSSMIDCFTMLDRNSDALRVHNTIVETFCNDTDEEILQHVVSAGTEAARALRAEKHYATADALVTSMEKQFGHLTGFPSRLSLAWARIELADSAYSLKKFDDSAAICEDFIAAWDVQGCSPNEWPLAWAYGKRAQSMRKGKRYREAVAICDDMLERFGDTDNADIQFQVAWTLVEKTMILRYWNRFTASMSTAAEIQRRFATATDKRIIGQRVWAFHAQGDGLVSEAKVLLKSGIDEEAALKLRRACDHFDHASALIPSESEHLVCKAYAQFLLGEVDASHSTFERALDLGNSTIFESDWAEFSIASLPQDAEFLKLLNQWRLDRSSPRRRR